MTGETEGEDERKTPLHRAAAAGEADWVRSLIRQGADVNAGDAQGHTPLHDAAREGHSEIVTLLLDAGADPNAVATEAGDQTPLLDAIDSGNIETVTVLLARGANVDGNVDAAGLLPIHQAAMVGTPEMVVALLDPNQALNSARLPRWCHRCGSAQMERGGRAVA